MAQELLGTTVFGRHPSRISEAGTFPKSPFFCRYRKQWSSVHLDECYGEIVTSMNITRTWLFLVAFHCAHGQSIDCSNLADRETGSKMGPGGVVAVLKVQSHDDNMKNSHQCMAEYHLHITLPDGREEAPDTGYGFTNSQAEWGRRVSVHLDGFS